MANASRVAEIFQQASVAFGRLAQLTLSLKLAQSEKAEVDSKQANNWTDDEVKRLKDAISRFGHDLEKIAEAIETKTLNQIKHKLKAKSFQDAGVSLASQKFTEDTETPSTPKEPGSLLQKRKQTASYGSAGVHPVKLFRLGDTTVEPDPEPVTDTIDTTHLKRESSDLENRRKLFESLDSVAEGSEDSTGDGVNSCDDEDGRDSVEDEEDPVQLDVINERSRFASEKTMKREIPTS
ncbi:unnamed protein product [Dicrocoelium dendriticum]|nr:unnamed protein product [Dicrocoelium dendriticum]